MNPAHQAPGQHIEVLSAHEERAIQIDVGAEAGGADLADALVAALDAEDHREA